MELNWKKLYFGRVSPNEVQGAVRDSEWQECRKYMKGMSLYGKYATLSDYLIAKTLEARNEHELRMVRVRVTNYVTALSRGGLIKPIDYRPLKAEEVAQDV